MSDPTTQRAQRLAAVREGRADTAVDTRESSVRGGGQRRNVPTRSRQRDRRREIADDIDIEREGVGAVDRIAGGIDVFLRSVGVREFDENVSRRFAEEADFVGDPEAAFPGAEEVDARVDGQRISASPVVAPDRRSDVATRARSQTAAETDFVEAADLRADVGPRGVRRLEIDDGDPATQRFASFEDPDGSTPDEDVREIVRQRPGEARSEDVAERTRAGLAGDDPFARPDDFGVEVGRRGIAEAALTDDGAQRRASRQFEAETPLDSVGPDDVTAADDGFELRDERQRDIAAIGLDPQFERQDLTREDIVATDDGFGPAEDVRRQSAAFQFEDSTALETVDPDADLQPTDDGFALDDRAQRRSAARGFEADIGLFGRGELDPDSDVRTTDDGFGLGREPARQVGAQQIDQELEDIDVSPDDVTLEETDSGQFEAVFEREGQR